MDARSACILFFTASSDWSFATAPIVPAPQLTYSTYLRDGFQPTAVTTDSTGNVYLAGTVTLDQLAPQTAAMVMKLNSNGSQYIYMRTLGGSLNETAAAIAVDSAGNAYITGMATSPDFPVTPGRQLGTPPTGVLDPRTFLVKLDPQGYVVFSEFLGGSVTNSGAAVALTAMEKSW